MKKLWIILVLLLVAGAVVWSKSCHSGPLASRQVETVDAAVAAKAGEFAVKAIELSQKRPREFARLWADAGDVYQSSVNVLREHPLKQPQVVRVYCYASAKQQFYVELTGAGGTFLTVTVWRQLPDDFTLTEITVAPEAK